MMNMKLALGGVCLTTMLYAALPAVPPAIESIPFDNRVYAMDTDYAKPDPILGMDSVQAVDQTGLYGGGGTAPFGIVHWHQPATGRITPLDSQPMTQLVTGQFKSMEMESLARVLPNDAMPFDSTRFSQYESNYPVIAKAYLPFQDISLAPVTPPVVGGASLIYGTSMAASTAQSGWVRSQNCMVRPLAMYTSCQQKLYPQNPNRNSSEGPQFFYPGFCDLERAACGDSPLY